MLSPSPRRPRALALAATLLLAPLAAACGVEANDAAVASGGATTTAPCRSDESGGETGGAIGADRDRCKADPDPQVTTTTTEDRPDETTTSTTSTTVDATTTTVDGTDGDRQAYVDALARGLSTDETFGKLSSQQADRIGGDWVDTLGPDRLQAAGISPEDLVGGDLDDAFDDIVDEPTARELIRGVGDCGVDIDQLIADELRTNGDLPADKVDCIVAALPDGFVERLLAVSLSGGRAALNADPTLAQPVIDAATSCQ